MKTIKTILLSLIVLGLASCNSNPLLGEWKMIHPDQGDEAGDVGEQMAKQMMATMDMVFEFKDGGELVTKVSFMGKTQEEQLGYKIEDNRLILSKEGEEDKAATFKVEGNQLTISEMDGSSMEALVFEKK